MPFFVIVIFAASDHWSGSYISQTKYTANGLAEGGLLASGQPLLSDRTLTHLTRSDNFTLIVVQEMGSLNRP